ncbi:MAG: glycosyltransferase family 4 protein [Candidatus Omnitrophica bacterium]|nr:glycosyltransferase family 4 protein [Candidatus Omnitrophota bacterium]MDD5238070.1 glycosyltransferase family 4 protein [Candidatus Omnitrophota bacterium]
MEGIKNILILHEAAEISGAENSLIGLAKNIDRSKFNPIFILPKAGPFFIELKKLGIEVYANRFPRIRRGLGVFAAVKKLRHIIKEKDIRLIHSNSIRTHMYGAIIAKLSHIPVIWHQRNLISKEIIDPDRLLSFIPDKIICNSFAVARRFLKKGNLPDKVKVIYNGVDVQKFNPQVNPDSVRQEFGIKTDEVVVGIVSRFHPVKGYKDFFNAAKIMLHDMPLATNLRFLVAGGAVFKEDKYMEKALRGMVINLGLEEKIIFTGVREDMPQVYAAIDIFVFTSHLEACARVILEAMASAKPIVAVNAAGTPELIENGISGFLVEPRNPGSIAEKTTFFINNKAAAKKIGEEARRIVEEKFSIKKNAEEIQKVYSELIENSRN